MLAESRSTPTSPQVPAHVTGWMSNSLATSSLLKAVGVGAPGGAEGAAAAAAAIKWITKDGIGAAGRVLVGLSLPPINPHTACVQPGVTMTMHGAEYALMGRCFRWP